MSPARAAALPPVALVRRHDTHRLIPSRFSEPESVLAPLAENEAHLSDIFDLDHATNDRLLAEHGRLPGIGVHELIFGIPYYRIVNAAFTHAHPHGGRFNSPERGAWYTSFELKTAQAEVAFHKTVHLAEIGRFEDTVVFDEYLSDFSGEFHDLRGQPAFTACLDPDSYIESQALAARLLEAHALGVVYPSARRREGTCLACFRPALVMNVRKAASFEFRWEGRATPSITRLRH